MDRPSLDESDHRCRRGRAGPAPRVAVASMVAALVIATGAPVVAAQEVPYPPLHLAIGTPGEDIGAARNAGSVTILAGEPLAVDLIYDLEDYLPTPARTRTVRQGEGGLGDRPERGDSFGSSIVFGDFDRNGAPDVAIGAPGEDLRGKRNVGMVHVIAGSGFHFGGGPVTRLHRARKGVAGRAGPGDRFGHALAVVDLNGDGFDDLAVGIPGEDRPGAANAGAVQVFFGSRRGLTGRSTLLIQGRQGLADQPERADRFGSVLAGHSGSPALVVGIPNEDIDGFRNGGAIQVIAPSRPWTEGLHTQRSLELLAADVDDPGPETVEAGDRFGAAVTVDARTPRTRITVGAPGEDIDGIVDAGAVMVADFGGPFTGSLLPQIDRWSQNDSRLPRATAETGDAFGSAIAGSFSWTWVGVPGEDTRGRLDSGAVQQGPSMIFDQSDPAVPGENGNGDRMGVSVATFWRGTVAVFGVPGEDGPGARNAGSVLWYSLDNNQHVQHWLRFDPDDVVGPGAAERGDRFGSVLAMN